MRDKRFVAEHRGGPLTKDIHRALIRWAIKCAEHILPLIGAAIDERLSYALRVAKDWENGKATTGDAMRASLGAHAVARESENPVLSAVARAVGHTVATAHMADHSIGAPLYALKALTLAGKSLVDERAWQTKQINQLPPGIAELVLDTINQKKKGFKL
jgi:hypothetical protein